MSSQKIKRRLSVRDRRKREAAERYSTVSRLPAWVIVGGVIATLAFVITAIGRILPL